MLSKSPVGGSWSRKKQKFMGLQHMTFQGSRHGLLEVAQQRPLTKIKDTVITAGQEPPETLTRGSGLVFCPAWNLLSVRPFTKHWASWRPIKSTPASLQGHSCSDSLSQASVQEAWSGSTFALFGQPGDFQLLSFLSQLPLPQSPPRGGGWANALCGLKD